MIENICKNCEGVGKIKGVGHMMQECWICKGKGRHENIENLFVDPTPLPSDPFLAEDKIEFLEITPKRRGRPKKDGYDR